MALYGVDLDNMEAATFERHGAVALVTFNRPEGANSLNTQIHRDIGACWDEINTNDEILAAVVTANGRFFCAGRDIKEFVGTYNDGTAVLRAIDDPDHDMFGRLANHWHVTKPLVGALNGPAVGGGLEVVIMCDMIVMDEDAYIADLHAKINVGGMTSLTTWLPPMIANELTMTERRLTAQEAVQYGLANYAVPRDQLVEKALELATATTKMGPDSIRRLKQGSIDTQLKSGNIAPPEAREERRAMARANALQARQSGSHDGMEGMRAFAEKRQSEYDRKSPLGSGPYGSQPDPKK